jgi:hypothetical protein
MHVLTASSAATISSSRLLYYRQQHDKMAAQTISYPTAHTTNIENPRLRLLAKLRNGEFPLMTFMAIPSVRMAQIVALTGLDSIIIDCEHGNIGDDSMHNSVAAISALGVSPIIRIRGPAHDIIKRALDTGAHGIMVPQINNAEEAYQIVQSSKFPPQGMRGQGSAFPAIGHGLTTPEYMVSANETILTMIQIETRAGVENVDAWTSCSSVPTTLRNPFSDMYPRGEMSLSLSLPLIRLSRRRESTGSGLGAWSTMVQWRRRQKRGLRRWPLQATQRQF